MHTRVDVDQEDWPSINSWMDVILDKLDGLELVTALDYLDLSEESAETGYSRTRPFTATMTVSVVVA